MHQPILPPKSDPPQMVVIPKSEPPPRLELLMQGEDEEITVRMRVPPHLLWSCRPNRLQYRGPNWGLILGLVFCLAFWGSIAYWIWG